MSYDGWFLRSIHSSLLDPCDFIHVDVRTVDVSSASNLSTSAASVNDDQRCDRRATSYFLESNCWRIPLKKLKLVSRKLPPESVLMKNVIHQVIPTDN
jgi:hypothetical protein